MNLISCDHCATVLDHDKLPFPNDIWDSGGYDIDPRKAEYNQNTGKWTAYTRCPVCEELVYKED